MGTPQNSLFVTKHATYAFFSKVFSQFQLDKSKVFLCNIKIFLKMPFFTVYYDSFNHTYYTTNGLFSLLCASCLADFFGLDIFFIFLFWDSDAFDSQLEHFQNWYIRERNIFSVFLSVLTPAQVSMMHNSATPMPGSTFCQKFLVHFLFAFSGVRDQILPDQ